MCVKIFVSYKYCFFLTICLFFNQAMVSHGRVELLAHPLSQKYLQMKWNTYGKYFHLAHLLFYTIFLIFVTLFSSQLMVHNRNSINDTNTTVLAVDNVVHFECVRHNNNRYCFTKYEIRISRQTWLR